MGIDSLRMVLEGLASEIIEQAGLFRMSQGTADDLWVRCQSLLQETVVVGDWPEARRAFGWAHLLVLQRAAESLPVPPRPQLCEVAGAAPEGAGPSATQAP